jgi:hypothetical protein
MAKKTSKTKKTSDLEPIATEPVVTSAPEAEIPEAVIEDPIGDETDGEAKSAIEAEDSTEPDESAASEDEEDEPEFNPKPRPACPAAARPKNSSSRDACRLTAR